MLEIMRVQPQNESIDNLKLIAEDIVSNYYYFCEKGTCDVSIGEYLSSLSIEGLSIEAVAEVWAMCMASAEQDVIIQFYNTDINLDDIRKITENDYRIIGE